MPIAGEELAAGKRILRLVKDIPRFIPPGYSLPTGDAFEPSTDDKEEARKRAQPVRVSVWDLELTTVEQAKAFRASEQLLAFDLMVQDVIDVRQLFNCHRLRVVADPFDVSQPGAYGHCGIEGLDRQKGEDRKTYRATLDELAKRAKPI